MKTHIEENFGVESEAAKIFVEAIQVVICSVEQRPQYHTVPLHYAIKFASWFSISAYDRIRQLIFLTTIKHAKKCKPNSIFEKNGTIKECYQVHAVRVCRKKAKYKGSINLNKQKKSVCFGQRCNDNQYGFHYFEQEEHQESNYWVCHSWRIFCPRDYVQQLCPRCDKEVKRKVWFYLPRFFARWSCWKSWKFSLICQGIESWHQCFLCCCIIRCVNQYKSKNDQVW